MNDIEKLSMIADQADALLSVLSEVEALRNEVRQLSVKRQKPYTTAQAAEHCGVTPATIVNWVNRGLIPAIMSKGGYLIPADKLFSIAEKQAAERASQYRSNTLSV